MSQLINHFYFLDEVFHSFLRQVPLSKSLNSDLGSKPLPLVDITITSTTNKVILNVKADFRELNEKVKPTRFEALYQSKLSKILILVISCFVIFFSSLIQIRSTCSLLLFKVSN